MVFERQLSLNVPPPSTVVASVRAVSLCSACGLGVCVTRSPLPGVSLRYSGSPSVSAVPDCSNNAQDGSPEVATRRLDLTAERKHSPFEFKQPKAQQTFSADRLPAAPAEHQVRVCRV